METSSPSCSCSSKNNTIQLIDENQNLHLEEFAKQIKDVWNLHQLGTAYRIISVMGSQSSGKSTLLNSLFGTEFAVMDEYARMQTTKGIWISSVESAPETLVMDVEGTDGRERGENQDFERKGALFSLALSEVLIINLWEHSIGLYHGANMALLKTVFEVNLELFARQEASKTCLFFVIRDFLGKTPKKNLAASIRKDLERLWNALAKPKGFEHSQLDDFFHLEIEVLPHKFHKEEEFRQGIQSLSRRFFDSSCSDFLFPNQRFMKSVPADGLAIYVSSIWSQILQNKDLDLPTQQQLLSQFRCDEIAKEVFDAFKQEIALHEPYSIGNVDGEANALAFDGKFLQKALQLRNKHLKQFAEEAHRYHSEVVHEKSVELCTQIDACICKILAVLAKCALQEALPLFSKYFESVRKDKKNSFKHCIEVASSKATQDFTTKMSSIESAEIEGASFDFIREEFTGRLNQQVSLAVERNARKILDSSRSNCNSQIDSIIDSSIETFFTFSDAISVDKEASSSKKQASDDEDEGFEEPNGWSSLIEAINECIQQQKQALESSLASDLTAKSSIVEFIQEFQSGAWKYAVRKCSLYFDTEAISAKLHSIFEKDFKHDSKSQMPRIWSNADDVDTEYLRALTNGLSIVDAISSFDAFILEEALSASLNSDAVSLSEAIRDIMNPNKAKIITEKFKRHADVVFVETKRSLIASKTHIPPWILVLLLVLGWREITAVLKNPLYLFFVAILAIFGYAVFALGLQRPLEALVRQVVVGLVRGISSFVASSGGGHANGTDVTR